MEYIISAIIGYLFGCVNTAYIVAKLKGINIKKTGTTNAGASNVFISVGKIYGVFAAIGDVLKSFIAAELMYLIFDNFEAGIIAGGMAVIGHIFPFWIKFNGGKGLASLMGLILFYDFWACFFTFLFLIAVTLITDFIALGSLSVATVMTIYVCMFDERSVILPVFIILTIIIWFKHRENIVRIKNKTEIGFLRKNKYKK